MRMPLSPDPILDAVESYSGTFVDLDNEAVVGRDEFQGVVQDLETFVRKEGVVPGELVVMAVGNGPMFPATLAAILRTGGSPVLVHADTPLAEVRRVSRRFGARFLFSDLLRESDLSMYGLRGHEISSASWATGVCAELLVGESDPGTADALRLEGVPLHPTSGTTGTPKLAIRPGAAAVAEARHYVDTIGIDGRDIILCTIPMSHAYGFGMCAMVPLLSGANLVSMRRYNAKVTLRELRRQAVTVYPSAPFAIDLLLIEGGDALPPPPGCITSAGAPLPERTASASEMKWGATVRPLYGTTETGGISVATVDHDSASVNSVGPPMEGVELEVRAMAPMEDDGGESGVGSLWIRSPSMMSGYLGAGGIDGPMLDEGWFETGDLGFIDEAGNIRLRGRAAEVINVFGLKVLPSEVEEVIALLPQVAEVRVYGRQNRWGSQSVRAAVVTEGQLDEARIRDHCREHLVGYKRPDQIVLLDRMPRTPSGKVVLSELP